MTVLLRVKKIILVLILVHLFNFSWSQVQYAGVNLAGAEFGEGNLPGTYNQTYTYPTRAEVDYFTSKGMNVFRLPFRWERLQHSTLASFNTSELSRIKSFISYAASKKAKVILDPHNYARYYGEKIGSANVPATAFADFWEKLATEFANDTNVIFGLMNEPHSMATESWLESANTAIAAIRSAGAKNLILVPGNGYTGAHSWTSNWYGTPNGQVMKNVTDPENNYAFEVHQYFDSNSSGSSETCVSASVGADRLKTFTSWLRSNNQKGFLGEFGISSNQTCLQALDNMLEYMHANSDVWLGWTYWAAGPWWGDYMFSIEPKNGQDKPQMDILEKYLQFSTSINTPGYENNIRMYNSPNPFRSTTHIELFLPQSSHIHLSVFDPEGNFIITLVNAKMPAGHHKVLWDGTNRMHKKVPAGVYYGHLTVEKSGSQTIKMVCLNQ